MDTNDISIFSLAMAFLMLLYPVILSYVFNLKIIKDSLISVLRMTVQLFIMSLILAFLFEINNIWINIGWIIFMILFATIRVIQTSKLKMKKFVIPVFSALLITSFIVLLYFNYVILRLSNVFEARYFIVIGGMLLGNSLTGNIIGIGNFYKDIKRNKERYLFNLGNGATIYEAAMPYFRNSVISALKPTIASMATIGIVYLPGMMTGQILGGANPQTAIKYQIAIMLAILLSVSLSVTLTIIFTIKSSFDEYGIIKDDVFQQS
ncbi:ABC transporter permease [Petrotoga sp. 9PWA.NaAc.5.4]|uniref:ABC transporter permease n=1 Tax=Petrotoga sp. 9PWA.NaAc.5.4 TaxID=1434328 RepID=UPI000CB0BC0D|nr:ABC transporter permease [Petrotoga sp. 9PWA.NaAc.5.4]PNR97017.1 ABC transporter ATP-binding protein [Petrotoga sp. 9PWA.NaAc.5.4]